MAAPRAEIPIVVLSESTPISYVAGATVYVKVRATEATAKVFANSGASESELGQPLSSDSLGRITGWLERGSYKVEITIPGKSAYTEYLDIVPATDGSVTNSFLASEAVTGEKVASSLKNGAAGTPTLRSLGTGATEAAAGNDSRFSDERVPTAGSVTTAKLANGAVTTDKLATGVVAPPGTIHVYAGTVAPTGFLMCSGQLVTKTSYEPLFAILGYKFGGSGTVFGIPDLRGRAVVGEDSAGLRLDGTWAPRTFGQVGGSMWLQAHGHGAGGFATFNQQFLPQQYLGGNYNNYSPQSGFNAVSGWSTSTNAVVGSSATEGIGNSQNMPPYVVLNYVIKT